MSSRSMRLARAQKKGTAKIAVPDSKTAEGTRLELATPCGASHFQCDR